MSFQVYIPGHRSYKVQPIPPKTMAKSAMKSMMKCVKKNLTKRNVYTALRAGLCVHSAVAAAALLSDGTTGTL